MKNALIYLFLVTFITSAHSQIVPLDEAKVTFNPKVTFVSSNTDGFVMRITEEFRGEFSQDPLLFLKNNFDLQPFIYKSRKENFDSYLVDFRTDQGHLEAQFDKKGELVRTSQKFKNVRLPMAVRKDLLKNHKGWNMIRNTYVASGKKYNLDKEVYRLRLKKGKQSKTLVIKPEREKGLASN